MKFIRKYALPLTMLSVLCAAVAAPYMIPENPDSPVFRSGWLGLILLISCASPVKEAFQYAQKRSLLVSLVFGYLFSLALSLGSELFVYSGLLRGVGPMIRRFMIPLLFTPLIGGLCCRLTCVSLPRQRLRIPFFGYMLIILLCWLPVWLAFWPANICFDFTGEYAQHLENAYSSLHPLLHSVIQNGLITLGEALVDRTFGLALLTLVQMLCLSGAMAACCRFLQNGGSGLLSLGLALFFGLHPTFSVLAVSTTKDTMFAAALIFLFLMTWSLLKSPDEFLRSKGKCIGFVVVTVFTALLRNNGLFALVLTFPALIIAAKGYRKKVFFLSAAGALASVAVFSLLSVLFHCESMPSRQLYSLPAQQLVRAYNLSPNLTQEDKEEIRSWYLSDDGLVLLPQLADPAKGYLDEALLKEKGGDAYLSLWADHLDDSAHEYLEAFLLLNIGSWYIDDRTHSMIYPEQAWNGQGYISLSEPGVTEQGFEMTCYLPKVRQMIKSICSSNRYQRIPLISLTFSPAFAFWMLVLSVVLLIARRHARFVPASMGVFGLWLSYLMGPCTLPRYALPLFVLAPVLLIAALQLPVPKDLSDNDEERNAISCKSL